MPTTTDRIEDRTDAEVRATGTAAGDRDEVLEDEVLEEDEVLLEEISIDGMCGVY